MKQNNIKNPQFATPILLVVFNRPEYTKLVFEEIRKQRPISLFISADGPRKNRPDDIEKCHEVRAIVSNIDWPCNVKTLFRETNFGFAQAEKLAFDWFFENVEEGIILEDDQLPHPSFFRFMAEMLERYRNNEQIMMITGGNLLPDFEIKDSYFFSKFFSIWGWATWRRAWEKYDFDMRDWGDRKNRAKLKTLYHEKYMVKHMTKMFDDVYLNKDTWDAQWAYACIMKTKDSLCVVPKINLISNIGVIGTHRGGGINQNLPTFDIYKEGFTHPSSIIHNEKYDNAFYERNYKPKPQSLREHLRYKIISILVRYEAIKKIYRSLVKLKTFVLSIIS